MKIFIDEQNILKFNSCDVNRYRYDESGVTVNHCLIGDALRKRKELGLPRIQNKRYKYEKYNDMFVLKTLEDGTKRWYYIQEGYLLFSNMKYNQWEVSLLMHQSGGSSWFSNIEFAESGSLDFNTLTSEIPDDFNNEKDIEMIKLKKEYRYIHLEKVGDIYDYVADESPIWDKEKFPELIIE